jgi:hypothetical protein
VPASMYRDTAHTAGLHYLISGTGPPGFRPVSPSGMSCMAWLAWTPGGSSAQTIKLTRWKLGTLGLEKQNQHLAYAFSFSLFPSPKDAHGCGPFYSGECRKIMGDP